ncbi:hypothetical protein ACMD2_27216 [Ananas comosus]|uniref:DUF7792 domain-containing protein n=1 Tax=Ananas comosus TaxID=4615 RepID=A0A199VLU1_ANACO|nr:hypothetical protein ACMD2_27216 [Ananas comosus]
MMGDGVKSMLAKPIHLAEQVRKLAGDAQSSRPECAELQVRAERLAALLRQAARAELYGRLAARIIDETSDVLARPRPRREVPPRPQPRPPPLHHPPRQRPAPHVRPARQLHRRRLLAPPHLLASGDDDGLHGLPNIARDEPMLCLIWEHIARLHTGSSDARADSARQLASLARDSDHFAKLIIEEDGVGPLVRFLKEGSEEGQESAAARSATRPRPGERGAPRPRRRVLRVRAARAERGGDPETKAYLKAMAANALWRLAQGNISICQSITESRALLCFAVLLEKGVGRVRYYSAMALMEIARVAEHNVMLRQSAFKPSSPTAKAVVDQLLRIVWNGVYDELLQPSITALGCLSRTFQASETRIIGPLVALLDESEAAVSKEAVIALTKFACSENHLHVNHCKAVIDAGGARHLVQLVYLGEQVQIEALILLCYIALHVPDSEELAQAGVLAVLLWASKQAHMGQDSRVESLLPEAKARMELFQSRESR